MKVRKLLILGLIVTFAVLQSTALNHLRILHTQPDFLLLLVIFFSLYYGHIYGLLTGAVAGIFAEATCGLPAGTLVFSYALGGLVLGYVNRWVYPLSAAWRENLAQRILSQIRISFIFVCFVYLVLFFLLRSADSGLSFVSTLISIILPSALYTAFAAPLLLRGLSTVLPVK